MIRPATVADITALLEIRTSVRENHLSVAQLAELGITPASLAEMIATGGGAWVAEQAGQCLGFSMADAQDGCLFALFVRPAAEGQGIGAALLAQTEAWLLARRPSLWLETSAGSRAHGFYLKHGWQPDGQASQAGDVRLVKHAS